MKAVILAGGKGTRLRPYTANLPKPLVKIGDKPIIEIIIRQLASQNITDIMMAIGHLGEQIIGFCGDGSRFGVNIKYSQEDEPLGTAGGLDLMRTDLNETFLMINGDTLTSLKYDALMNYHKDHQAMATIALKGRQVYIDFGVVELDGEGFVGGYTEKPSIDYLVSMGVYVFEPKALEYIKSGERLDFPDLIKRLLANGEKVKGFNFDGYWLDIGRPEDYERANEEIGSMEEI